MSRASILFHPMAAPPKSAEEWFARLHAPDRTKADESAFQEWLRADPRHADEYNSCEMVSALSGELRIQHALVDDLISDAGLDETARTRPSRWNPRIALAAAFALAALAFAIAYNQLWSPHPNSVTTAHGEQRHVALADGSHIQLNTDTVLAWRVNESERRVDLERGEAFFDVAKDPRRPFIVHVGTSQVRVVGTQFSVRRDAGRLDVVVKEGKVDVIPDSTRAVGPEPTKVELTPGKRLSYDDSHNLVRVAVVEPDRALGWRTGSIEFDSATLEDALAELNRYAAKPLVIEDDRLRTLSLSGRFRAGDTDAVTFTLKERFDIEAQDKGDRVALRMR